MGNLGQRNYRARLEWPWFRLLGLHMHLMQGNNAQQCIWLATFAAINCKKSASLMHTCIFNFTGICQAYLFGNLCVRAEHCWDLSCRQLSRALWRLYS
jgi:hypothetical protein